MVGERAKRHVEVSIAVACYVGLCSHRPFITVFAEQVGKTPAIRQERNKGMTNWNNDITAHSNSVLYQLFTPLFLS